MRPNSILIKPEEVQELIQIEGSQIKLSQSIQSRLADSLIGGGFLYPKEIDDETTVTNNKVKGLYKTNNGNYAVVYKLPEIEKTITIYFNPDGSILSMKKDGKWAKENLTKENKEDYCIPELSIKNEGENKIVYLNGIFIGILDECGENRKLIEYNRIILKYPFIEDLMKTSKTSYLSTKFVEGKIDQKTLSINPYILKSSNEISYSKEFHLAYAIFEDGTIKELDSNENIKGEDEYKTSPSIKEQLKKLGNNPKYIVVHICEKGENSMGRDGYYDDNQVTIYSMKN